MEADISSQAVGLASNTDFSIITLFIASFGFVSGRSIVYPCTPLSHKVFSPRPVDEHRVQPLQFDLRNQRHGHRIADQARLNLLGGCLNGHESYPVNLLPDPG